MARILVTDGDQRSSLSVVRSLGRAGHEITVCSSARRSLAGVSRHARRQVSVPDVSADVDAFVAAIRTIAAENSCDLVIPMTDASITALLHRDDPEGAESRPKLVLPQPHVAAYERASDKARLTALAMEAGVPVPEQIVVGPDGEAAAARFGDRVGWPVILKPSRSAARDGNRIVRTGVETADSREALGAALGRIPPKGFPVLVQRRVTGPGLGIFLFAMDGEVTAWFAHRRIREKPPTGGVSVYRESIECRPDLVEHSRKLIERLNWTGVAMVEFKEESATGIPYLMEINARFWGSLQLAVDAGIDFPRLLVDATLGRPLDSVRSYRVGIRSRWFWGDVDHLLWILRAPRGFRKLNPSLPSRSRAVLRFLLPWRPGDRWEVFRVSDPRPFLNESITWFSNLFR